MANSTARVRKHLQNPVNRAKNAANWVLWAQAGIAVTKARAPHLGRNKSKSEAIQAIIPHLGTNEPRKSHSNQHQTPTRHWLSEQGSRRRSGTISARGQTIGNLPAPRSGW
jgi:hypothetical protein